MFILFLFILAWMVIFIFLKFFEILSSGLISSALQQRNITLKFGYISIYTTAFNTRVDTFARSRRRPLTIWFNIGAFFAFFGLLFSVIILSSNVVHLFLPSAATSASLFVNLPRVPFHSVRPWWIPSPFWALLSASDHHPASLLPLPGMRDMHSSALKWDVRSWSLKKKNPEPTQQSEGKKGCGSRREHFREEVGRVITMPAWLGRDRKKRKRYSLRSSFSSPRRSRRILALDDPSAAEDSDQRTVSDDRTASDDGAPWSASSYEKKSVSSAQARSATFLTPLVPGITVPAGDVWYMLAAVLLAAVVHELGHAIAASTENGELSGIGAFIAVLLPGAYVKLRGVEDMSPRSQLRVYCAGAWHNVVSAILALLVLKVLPLVLAPGFVIGGGALVVFVPPISPLFEHISPGDIVLRIGSFEVTDGGASFRHAVHRLVDSHESVGFCISDSDLKNFSHSAESCCDRRRRSSRSATSLSCFRLQGGAHSQFCMDGARISSGITCQGAVHCTAGGSLQGRIPIAVGDGSLRLRRALQSVDSRMSCIVPVLKDRQQLVDVRVRSSATGNILHFFYEGYAQILGQSVTVSSYIPRAWAHWPLSLLQLIAGFDIPNVIERFLQYVCSISLGLAILNMAPVLFLDGEASVGLFVRVLFPGVSEKRVLRIRAALLLFGSSMLFINLIVGLWNMDGG